MGIEGGDEAEVKGHGWWEDGYCGGDSPKGLRRRGRESLVSGKRLWKRELPFFVVFGGKFGYLFSWLVL